MGGKKTAPDGIGCQGPDAPLVHRSLDIPRLTCVPAEPDSVSPDDDQGKGGSILRVETTIHQPGAFRSYRASQSEPDWEKSWRPMRKGIAGLHCRAEASPLGLSPVSIRP